MARNNRKKKGGRSPAGYRDARTGRYVTEGFASKHKSTTVRETKKNR